jgi:two-component system, OmpR family, sensor histidine kinase BaeS
MLVRGRGRLGTRLVLAFVGVALAAEAVFASITLLTTRHDLAGLATTQRSNTTTAVVSALENAYEAHGGWPGADIKPALVLVHVWGAALQVVAPTGTTLFRAGPAEMLSGGDPIGEHIPLKADGRAIGTLHLVFPSGGLTPGDRRLRSDLGGAVEISAVIAAAVALLVAVVVAKGLLRPIRRLSEAAQALGSGTKGIRVGEQTGPGELVELARAFDSMAASLEHHEHLRQAMVADVAHELRTPVAILQAETEALVDGVSAPTPDALVSLHDESLRLGRMVQDL